MLDLLWTAASKWAVFGMVLLVLEMFTQTFFILFFGLGALIVWLVMLMLDLTVNQQLLVFAVSSVILLLTLRNYVRDVFFLPELNQDLELGESFVGERVKVMRKVGPALLGKVEFNGSLWSAVSESNHEVGDIVEIVKKDNITLEVKGL